MSKYTVPIVLAVCVIVVIAVAAVAFCNILCKEDKSTYLFIGEHEVTTDGPQFSYEYGNIDYCYDTNTVTISNTALSIPYSGYKEYDDIMLSEDSTGKAKFALSYEGDRDLNIIICGDVRFIADSDGIFGGIYIDKNVNVSVTGPGKIIGDNLTHAVIYGKKASTYISDVVIDTSNKTMVTALASDTIRLNDVKIHGECTDDPGVAALYAPNGSSMKDCEITSVGFYDGVHLGTTYIYDSTLYSEAKGMGYNFYACVMYDSTVTSYSEDAGMYFYDPLKAVNCTITSKAENLYAIGSPDTTLEFEKSTVTAYVKNGAAIQAWMILADDSTITAESANGSGIMANFNATAGGIGGIIADKSDIRSEGTIAAVWSYGDLVITGSQGIENYKSLSSDTPRDLTITALCDKNAISLELAEDESGDVYPVNAAKEVILVTN